MRARVSNTNPPVVVVARVSCKIYKSALADLCNSAFVPCGACLPLRSGSLDTGKCHMNCSRTEAQTPDSMFFIEILIVGILMLGVRFITMT